MSIKQQNRLTTLSLLEKYDLQDLNTEENQVLIGEESFKGPLVHRTLQDKRYLCLFLLILLIFLTICSYLINVASLDRLSHPSDFRSELCGTNHLKQLPYLYYLVPLIDPHVRMCVSSCPIQTGPMICLPTHLLTPTIYCYTQLKTTLVQQTCMPVEPLNQQAIKSFDQDQILNSFSIIYSQRVFLGIAMVFSVLITCVFRSVMSCSVRVMVWLVIWTGLLGWLGMAGIARYEYTNRVNTECLYGIDIHSCAQPYTYYILYFSYSSLVMGLLSLLYTMTNYNQIQLVISLMKTAIKTTDIIQPLKVYPYLLTIPVYALLYLTTITLSALFAIANITVIPAKDIDGGHVRVFKYETYWVYLTIPLSMTCLLLVSVFKRIGEMSYCLAICIWYFTKHKQSLMLPVSRCLKLPIQYHLGSIFKLSILYFFLSPLSSLLSWLYQTLRKGQQHKWLNRTVQWVCMPLLGCHHYVLRFISHECFVHICLWGEGYKVSSKKSYYLRNRNKEVTRDVNRITSYVLVQLKYVCALAGAVLYWSMLYVYSPQSYILPGVVYCLIVCYYLTAVIVDQYHIITKSIIVCYYIDNEMYIADQRYVEPFVEEYMHMFSNISKKGKSINVETYLPEYIAETNQQYYDPELEALKNKEIVETVQVTNQTIEMETTNKNKNANNNSSKYDQYGKPLTTKRQNKVGFEGNSMFNVQRREDNDPDYDPFNNQQFK